MIIGNAPAWTKANADLLAQFLQGGTGQLFLATLGQHRPPLSSGSDLDSVALQAKLVSGYEQAISMILSLAEPPREATGSQQEAYPPLDDDEAWKKQSQQ